MNIIIDAMGGDNAPLEIVKGAIAAAEKYDCKITLVGDEEAIASACKESKSVLSDNISVVHAPGVITMEDHALSVVRDKSDSSMAVGLHLLAEGKGDGFLSAGNTGALHAGSTLIVRRIKGIQRSAIATVLPYAKPVLLIDSGANTEVGKEQMLQFAIMGSIYMNKIFGIASPEVGLLNIGTERTKGSVALTEAFDLLESSNDINFIGNIEGKQLPFGACDVLVTDGFTGNIVLKLTEGLGSYLMKRLKVLYFKNLVTKFSAAIIKGDMTKFKNDFDASEYGGAPMLGISKPVIKAHGSADAKTIKNAVGQAISFAETGLIYEIVRHLPDYRTVPESAADKKS